MLKSFHPYACNCTFFNVRDGFYSAVEKLRTLGFQGIIIGMTADVGADAIQSFGQSGVDRVLTKPMMIEQLEHALAGKVASSHVRKSMYPSYSFARR